MARRPDVWHPGCCPELHFYGLRISHCPRCHHTFAGPHGFDAHKILDGCRDPEVCGMVLRGSVWHWPPRASLIEWFAKV